MREYLNIHLTFLQIPLQFTLCFQLSRQSHYTIEPLLVHGARTMHYERFYAVAQL